MKHDCNVARDLMPLMLDDAASEESKTLLNQHLEECADCQAYYDGMKAALPIARQASLLEKQSFDNAARKLRRKRRIRLWRRVAIGVLAGMVLMFAGLKTWSELTVTMETPVDFRQYNVFLSQLDDGRVSVNVDYKSDLHMRLRMEAEEEDGKNIFYVYNVSARIPEYLSGPQRGYSCTRLSAEEMENLYEIRSGVPEKYSVVWRTGDVVPAASAEMNRYFEIEQEMDWIRSLESNDRGMRNFTFEENQRMEELQEQRIEVYQTVPEWQ